MKLAQYIKVEYGEDPMVYGMIDGDHHQYVESFQATPFVTFLLDYTTYADTSDCLVSFFFFCPIPRSPCTIQSGDFFGYNMYDTI